MEQLHQIIALALAFAAGFAVCHFVCHHQAQNDVKVQGNITKNCSTSWGPC